jgi:polyferredoxin
LADGFLIAPQPHEKVLSTMEGDGSRIWLRPRLSKGRFLVWRRITAYVLIAVFTLIPHGRMNGKPLMLLDLGAREFTFFGVTFLATDTVLLALFLLATIISIFLFTALLGRVWCGWACPQTVYMEFLYRPIERLFEGTAGRGGNPRRRAAAANVAKYAVYLLASMFLAHTFLAYFVGVDALSHWIRRSPLEHPAAFLVMAATTALMMFNFCYFREQTCLVACPYGRLQSVLFDRDSLVIRYDETRGEPRGKLRAASGELRITKGAAASVGVATAPAARAATPSVARAAAAGPSLAVLDSQLETPRKGDCIDCDLCVATCPTGIDIRRGLQMECVACAQCIDACDAVMDKIGRPRGLIRYTSQNRLAGRRGRVLLRGRVFFYGLVFALAAGLFTYFLAGRDPVDISLLRGLGLPFNVLPDGNVSSQFRLKLTNRTNARRCYAVELLNEPAGSLTLTDDPLCLSPGETRQTSALIVLPRGAFHAGHRDVRLRVADDAGFSKELKHRVLGPADGVPAATQSEGR